MSVTVTNLSLDVLADEIKKLREEVDYLRDNRIYELFYKTGWQKPRSKFFRFSGDMLAASTHAKKHCADMNYTFIWCSTFIVDLDEQFEAKKRGELNEGLR